jgi:hypothetical protein
MEFETNDPMYATARLSPKETRVLVFENDSRSVVLKEFQRFGMRATAAWSDDPRGRVSVDPDGNVRFLVRPGFLVFTAVKAA